jgi:hypothetical protein
MHRIAFLLALIFAALTTPATAQTQHYYYYYVPVWSQPAATRLVSPPAKIEREALAAYGPFRVLDERTAALVGVTDSRSPAWFRAMLRDHPGLATLRFVECPGTYDDRANLMLGRLIRAAGLAAHVPAGGSVRSGAVELVLAGASLTIDDGAEFAVHAWLDEYGRGAADYAADSSEHRKYFAYYREMGMGAEQAASFYAMTNATPFERPRWLTGIEMRRWVGRGAPAPVLAASAPAPRQIAEAAAAAVAPAFVRLPAPVVMQAAALAPVPALPPAMVDAPRLAYLDLGLTLF